MPTHWTGPGNEVYKMDQAVRLTGKRFSFSKLRVTKFIFLFTYLIYILSVSRFMVLQDVNYFYFLKHFVILLPSTFSFFVFLVRGDIIIKRELAAIPLFLALVLSIYLLRGAGNLSDVLVFCQFFFFLCSCYFYADQLFSKEGAITRRDLIIMTCIAGIPLVSNILLTGGDFIYNSYYGRNRLLLGFFHPKEAAISLLCIIVLFRYYISYTIKPRYNQLFSLFCLVLLYLVQSRNSFLFFFNFTLINLLLSRVRVSVIIWIYFLLPFFIIGFSLIMFFEEIDSLSSSRLSFWIKQFNFSLFGGGAKIGDYAVIKNFSTSQSDNFYLQYLLENGIVFFVVLLVSLGILVNKIGKIRFNNVHVNALFISFLAYCFFDAGMFSSGNFFNMVIWSFVFGCIIRSIKERQQLMSPL
jgi:hypothetical protein